MFEVLTEAAYAAQQGIRDGSKILSVDADAVAAAPAFTLISGGTAKGPGYGSDPALAFDGLPNTFWESPQTFSSTSNWDCFIGKQYATPKQVRKIRVKWAYPSTEVNVQVSDTANPAGGSTVAVINVVFDESNADAWQEIILPAYTAKTSIFLNPKVSTAVPGTYWAANGGIIDRFRVYEIELYE